LKLEIVPPCKVFGSLHGQYTDLMRFFDTWKFPGPSESGGDIQANDYLFLGNYVDWGVYSLETMCLLLALKVKYPKQIHLLRGSHEDRWINLEAGFGEECRVWLKEKIDEPDSVFQRMNDLFEYMPLACSIGSKIFTCHGGIGSRINKFSDIENLKWPIVIPPEVTTLEHQIVMDLLWSDPTDHEDETGVV